MSTQNTLGGQVSMSDLWEVKCLFLNIEIKSVNW